MVKTGLFRLVKEGYLADFLKDRRLGLLCHQAAVLPDLTPAHVALKALFPEELVLLFAPQHGLSGTAQANMDFSADSVEPETGLPVISLYGPRLFPQEEHLAAIDVLLIDLQDVGCRVYTYVWTLLLCLKACARAGVAVVVLDRPNPLGGAQEGPLLEPDLFSFVGLFPLPMRHGLTLGELALFFKEKMALDLELKVVPLAGWRRDMFFPETGLPWLPPSPNMPRFETALVYPGQVLLEGTNLSEGRGTTTPFEVFGAPWLEPEKISHRLEGLPGVYLVNCEFVPWFDKWAGRVCRGGRLYVSDPRLFKPVRTSLLLLQLIKKEFPEFEFRRPPYEFEWQKWPFDIIVGNKKVRSLLEEGLWEGILDEGLEEFRAETRPFLLYT